jgi:archaellum component FlaC
VSKASDLIEEYLSVGGLFNPEIMNQNQHDAVRDTLIIARDEIRGLEQRIKRLEQTLEAVTDKIDNAWGIYMEFKEPKP